jgi:hypothetical protein
MAELWSLGVMDTSGTIFVRPPTSGQSLKDFASQMFGRLGIPNFTEDCFGSGKVDVQRFIGSAVGITVEIRENNKRGIEQYPFIIYLSPQGTSMAADYLVQHAHTLAWRFSREGFRCFVPKDMATVCNDKDGMIYDA